MDTLKIITGNINKFLEFQASFPDLQRIDLDLIEIQENDAQKIVEHKIEEAKQHIQTPFIIEDTSHYLK